MFNGFLKFRKLFTGLLVVFICLDSVTITGAIEMDELMDNILDDVRQETRQSIKQQARQETQEVITEDIVAPAATTTLNVKGSYHSIFVHALLHVLSLTQSGITVTGTGSDDPGGTYTFSGTLNGNTLTFSIKGTGNCTANASGSGTFSGDKAGDRFKGTISGIDCVSSSISETFELTKQ